jgi:hypothetical protein
MAHPLEISSDFLIWGRNRPPPITILCAGKKRSSFGRCSLKDSAPEWRLRLDEGEVLPATPFGPINSSIQNVIRGADWSTDGTSQPEDAARFD